MSGADQRRAPRRPGLSSAERGRPDGQGAKPSYPPSWAASSCSFGESRGSHGALSDAGRATRRPVLGQSILGKVRHYHVWVPTANLTVTLQYFTSAADSLSAA